MNLRNSSEKISRILQRCEICIGVLCLFSLFVLMISNTFCRYVLAKPILWSDELNNFFFVWTGFLGAAYIMGEDGHIRVTAILNILPPLGQYIVRQISNALFLIACIIFMEPCYRLLKAVTLSGLLRLPLKYIYFILPLSFGLMGLHVINNMIQNTCRLISSKSGKK